MVVGFGDGSELSDGSSDEGSEASLLVGVEVRCLAGVATVVGSFAATASEHGRCITIGALDWQWDQACNGMAVWARGLACRGMATRLVASASMSWHFTVVRR